MNFNINLNSNYEDYYVYSPVIKYSSQNFYVFFDFLLDEFKNEFSVDLLTLPFHISSFTLIKRSGSHASCCIAGN